MHHKQHKCHHSNDLTGTNRNSLCSNIDIRQQSIKFVVRYFVCSVLQLENVRQLFYSTQQWNKTLETGEETAENPQNVLNVRAMKQFLEPKFAQSSVKGEPCSRQSVVIV